MKNHETEEKKKLSIIDQIEDAIVLVLNEDEIGYCGGAEGGKEKAQAALRESIKTFIFLLDNWNVMSR